MKEQKDYTQHLQYNFFWVQHKVMVQLTCKIKQMKIEKIASTFFPYIFQEIYHMSSNGQQQSLGPNFFGVSDPQQD